jgi:hypothetical protein
VFFHETGDLVVPDDNDPDPVGANFDQLAWERVNGIIEGDFVTVLGEHTNGDSDFYGWWADTDNSTWTTANCIWGDEMIYNRPEYTEFTAARSGDIMIGIFAWDLNPGTYTLTVDTRVGEYEDVDGPEVTFNTYDFLKNGTFQVQVLAETDTNIGFEVNYAALRFENYFAPEMLTVTVAGTGASKTISWTSSDLNADDEHFYEVLISPDSGVSYQLLATNITTGSYVWDSTSFLARDTYRAMVRVYDNCPVENPDGIATGVYWMGLTDSMESTGVFSAGTITETPTDTTPTTTTAGPSPWPEIDPLWIGLIAGIGAGVVVVLILFLVKKR